MQFNMLDAKTKLSSLVAAAEQGEEVIPARDGVPVAKIVKYDKTGQYRRSFKPRMLTSVPSACGRWRSNIGSVS